MEGALWMVAPLGRMHLVKVRADARRGLMVTDSEQTLCGRYWTSSWRKAVAADFEEAGGVCALCLERANKKGLL